MNNDEILRYFRTEHLPAPLAEISEPIGTLARQMVRRLPEGAERSAGLRKLLEAKDCFVRASLTPWQETLAQEPAPSRLDDL